jgi:hypothetical protein
MILITGAAAKTGKAVEWRAECGPQPRGQRDVLDADRQTMQRPARSNGHKHLLGGPRHCMRRVGRKRNDSVQFWIYPFDNGEMRLEHLGRSHRPSPDERNEIDTGFPCQCFIGHKRYLPDQCTKWRSIRRKNRLRP